MDIFNKVSKTQNLFLGQQPFLNLYLKLTEIKAMSQALRVTLPLILPNRPNDYIKAAYVVGC